MSNIPFRLRPAAFGPVGLGILGVLLLALGSSAAPEQAGSAACPRIVLVGAAYKPDVGDTRNAPALAIREDLLARGFDVVTYDPLVDGYGGDLAVLASEADLVAILVPHRRVVGNLRAEADLVTAAMRRPLILDFSSGTLQAL